MELREQKNEEMDSQEDISYSRRMYVSRDSSKFRGLGGKLSERPRNFIDCPPLSEMFLSIQLSTEFLETIRNELIIIPYVT